MIMSVVKSNSSEYFLLSTFGKCIIREPCFNIHEVNIGQVFGNVKSKKNFHHSYIEYVQLNIHDLLIFLWYMNIDEKL